jgi:hypothetical protein
MNYPGALVVLVYETNDFMGFRLLANLLAKHHFLAFYSMRSRQLASYYDLFDRCV